MWMTSLEKTEHGSHVEEIGENVDIDEPTSFLDHVFLGCTQRDQMKQLLNSEQ